jgi:SPFH domain / Band 7 family
VGDFLRVILDSIAYLWPFRIVHTWERGGYYVFGKFWKELEPGCYPCVPFFTEVREVCFVDDQLRTSRQDLTLKDGSMVSLEAVASFRVVAYSLAENTVNDVDHRTVLTVESVIADKLRTVEASRLEPAGLGRLLSDLTRWVNEETQVFGVEVSYIRFVTFITNARTYRLLQ